MESGKDTELDKIEQEKDEVLKQLVQKQKDLEKATEKVAENLRGKKSSKGETANNLADVFFDLAVKTFFRRTLVTVDRFVFRLHYQLTTPVLFLAAGLFLIKQYFGKPIKCFLPPKKLRFPVSVVESYCWAEGTFSVPEAFNKTVGLQVPYIGVDQRLPDDEVVHHAYYQWVCFVLFIQAVAFGLPYMLWTSWENYNIFHMLRGLQKPLVKRRTFIYSIIYSDLANRVYAVQDLFRKYLLCQILCLVNVVAQIFIMDVFLGGRFSTFGLDVLNYNNGGQQVDPMKAVFPRLTKCTFHHFGRSGDVQRLYTLCVLPLNILNEKLYIGLWFWCLILTILTTLDLTYCLLAAASKRIRCLMTASTNLLVSRSDLRPVVEVLSGEQWFLLHMMGVNMDRLYFMELVQHIRYSLEAQYNSGTINTDQESCVV